MNAIIEARRLEVRAGNTVLLQDVALSISAGERVAIVGHNGAGKSTLLRSLSGFANLTHGFLRVFDTELSSTLRSNALRRLRSKVAQVHQGLHLVDRLSALDNVLIGAAGRYLSPLTWLRRWPESEQHGAHAVLESVGMGWAAARRIDSLSGGERQKVAIARALHQNAPILLADEPTADLDADAADEVASKLSAVVTARNATLICVVHNLDLLPRLADRAIVLRHGSVVADVPVMLNTSTQLRKFLK